MNSEERNFLDASKNIVAVLKLKITGMEQDARIRFIYNEATDDAINFVDDMAKSNPQHRMAYVALAKELRHWLPLREPE